MKFNISTEAIENYRKLLLDHELIEQEDNNVPGHLIVHFVLKHLDLPKIKSSQSTFKKPVRTGETLHVDLFQANDIIEYRVTSGRELRMIGTIELQERN